MSDTAPNQKEAGDAPEGTRNSRVGWLVWAVLLPVLSYVLSVGPVVWLVDRGYLPARVMFAYELFDYLPYSLQSLISQYLRWWS
jgi:hypothetical protein